jgi:hypothetical protein
MSIFVFLEADALDQRARNNGTRARQSSGQEENTDGAAPAAVRRPHRGIQIKKDTYGTLSVFDGAGAVIPLTSSSAHLGDPGKVNAYADFIIQKVEESRAEKSQIVETFGADYIFLYGEKPRMVRVSGLLVNTEDFNWRAQFWDNYENYLRGTKLVERNARVVLAYDERALEGYILGADALDDSNEPYQVPFSFNMFVTGYNDYSGTIGSTQFPVTNAPEGVDALNTQIVMDRHENLSSTAQVRAKAVDAYTTGSPGIKGAVGDFLTGASSFMNSALLFKSKLNTILSGRVVRVPLGVAGFLAQTGGTATLAAGSASEETISRLRGASSAKLAIIRAPLWAPMNPAIFRTRISANWDEYPLGSGAPDHAHIPLKTQRDLLSKNLVAKQYAAQQKLEQTAAAASALVASSALQTAVDVVNFAKFGFAMVSNINAVFSDPTAVMLDSLGLTGVVGTPTLPPKAG